MTTDAQAWDAVRQLEGLNFGAEPHGEDAAVMSAHEPSLGRPIYAAVNDALARETDYYALSPQDRFRASLSEFCDLLGIPHPSEDKIAQARFVWARLNESAGR